MRWRILESGDASSSALLHSLLAAISREIDEDSVSTRLAGLQNPGSPRSPGMKVDQPLGAVAHDILF
jgi:hypothetical protein